MARYFSRAGLSVTILLFLLVWLALRSLHREALLSATTVSLREERQGCLYRQGLDAASRLADSATYSRFFCGPRWLHPAGLCSVHRVVLRPERLVFEARVGEGEVKEVNRELAGSPWPLRATDEGWPQCARYVDEAFVFLVADDREEAPYYSLHVDTFLPLFSLLALRKHLGPPTNPDYTAVFFPAVEDYALQDVQWNTQAFNADKKFAPLQQMLEAFTANMAVIPLAEKLLRRQEPTICIRTAHFGVGVVNHSDPALLHSFSEFIRAHLSLPLPLPLPTKPLVCIIRRSSSPRILNEAQLESALASVVAVEVVQLAMLAYQEQVSHMQQVTVLVGLHGDELLSALYLPAGAVVVQLLPQAAPGLDRERYTTLLQARGPYLEWQNSHQENSRPSEVGGAGAGPADTVVHVEEFVELVTRALKLGLHQQLLATVEERQQQ